VADGSAGGAGTGMPLILDDLCGQLRQFGDLAPRLGRISRGRQGRVGGVLGPLLFEDADALGQESALLL
jgi:hypothetical protein